MNYRLDKLFELQMGKTPARANMEYWNGNNKWVSISDLSGYDKYVTDTKECISDLGVSESGIKVVPKNTVIMSFKLSIGKTAITTDNVFTNEAIMAFIDKGVCEINTDYLYYLFSGMDWNKGTNKAVLGLTLNKATLSKIEIDIPDLITQNEVVKKLDLLSNVIQMQKQSMDKLDELVKSRFVELFGNINTNVNGWNSQPLGELCSITRGGSPRPIEQFLGGDVPWIKIGDATEGESIYLNSTKEHIIQEGVKKSRLVRNGSLIFANCGVSLGFARIITFDGCIHDGWLAMENIDPRLNKVFLLQALNQMTDHFRSIAPAGTQPNLNTAIMKAYRQIIPPMELQNEFIAFVSQVEKQKSTVKKSIDKLETLKKSLMQEYFG